MAVVLVQMAQIALARRGEQLKTTLGSCVGVILHDAQLGVSGLAHIMLPERLRGDSAIGKYADSAIPELLAQMERRGGQRRNIQAYLTGGAMMFKASEDCRISSIGEKNIEAAHRILASLDIPVKSENTGGEQGRTILFDNDTGELQVRTLQKIIWKKEGK